MIDDDCRCPGCGTCDAKSEVASLRKSMREAKQKYTELSRMNESYVKHLHAAERERDASVAKASTYERDWREAKSEFGTAAAKLRDQVRELTKGRDELKARLAHAEALTARCEQIERERDELRKKAEVLLNERRQLRARLVECRAWAGCCPYPNTSKFDELMAIRALADDTLEEVKP